MPRILILSFLMMSSLLGSLSTPSRFTADGWWGGAEYLTVWRKKRYFPPLATGSVAGTSQGNSGILGLSSTYVLFGDKSIVGAPVAGVQGEFGIWLTCVLGAGVSAYSMGVEKIKDDWYGNGSGSPILARPFLNVQTGNQSRELLSFPSVHTNGGVNIETVNRIWGYDFYVALRRLNRPHVSCTFLGGFLGACISDSCDIYSQTQLAGTTTHRSDNFACKNNYYSGLVGFNFEVFCGCLEASILGKVGLGNMIQNVKVQGVTYQGTTEPLGTTFVGGLLALPTNIGNHGKTGFQVGTILDGHLRYSLCRHLYFSAGYKLWYFPKVCFAGEVISTTINTSQQNGGTLTGTAAPILDYNNTSFWTQSAYAGFYFDY